MSTPNFDRIARAYRWLEYLSFGPLLERCRMEYLDTLKSRQHALILGDGDGRFTSRLLKANSRILIDAVDASSAMLSLLQQRANVLHPGDRLTVHRADIRFFAPLAKYDLIVSHFFLDCLTDAELRSLVQKVKTSLYAEGLWIISEFAVPQTKWRSRFATSLITFLYEAFGWTTGLHTRQLPDYVSILQEAGFSLRKERQRLGGVLVSQSWRYSKEYAEQPVSNTPLQWE